MFPRGRRITPVILSGGSGSRLWPLSREANPKQFLPLLNGTSLFEKTIERVSDTSRFTAPIVVANQEHRFLVAERLRTAAMPPATILLEPCARNTAPAIAAAALLARRSDPDSLLIVLPSDHLITNEGNFHAAINKAAAAAQHGHLALFGISVASPATGYGYIRVGAALEEIPGIFEVDRFVEKPDQATARSYMSDGGYLWNSGMFVLPATLFLEELQRYQPDVMFAAEAALARATADMDFLRLSSDAFASAPSISIDYAVMEHTTKAAVIRADIGWTDLGSWSSMRDMVGMDHHGNACLGPSVLMDTFRSYIHSDGPLIATLGVSDLIVVAAGDAILVADANRDQDIKILVDDLKAQGWSTATQTPTVHRPWGYYRSLHSGDRFQVKRITVKPGARLSLQRHEHRAEHWVVVNGTALVTRDGEEFTLRENESAFLPKGCVHRLTNSGPEELNLIEVQSGSYLGEDDIQRFDDDYARI